MHNGGCRGDNNNHDTVNVKGHCILICVQFIFMRLVVRSGDAAVIVSASCAGIRRLDPCSCYRLQIASNGLEQIDQPIHQSKLLPHFVACFVFIFFLSFLQCL